MNAVADARAHAALDAGQVERSIQALRAEGVAVLPGLYGAALVEGLRRKVEHLHARLGSPPLFASAPQRPCANVEVAGTGLVLHQLLGHDPEFQHALLAPSALDVLRGVLGEGLRVELVAALLCDHQRPFFPWHHHAGGIDDERYRRLGVTPAVAPAERIAMLVYLDALCAENGQLLVYPERAPLEPSPGPRQAERWDGQREITGPAGTVVLMDQRCWHAVLPCAPRTRARIFVGLWFASASAPAAEVVDESLFTVRVTDSVLAQVMPKPSSGSSASRAGGRHA